MIDTGVLPVRGVCFRRGCSSVGESLWRRTVKYLLMIAGDKTAEAHANDGCGGWSEEMEQRGVVEGGGPGCGRRRRRRPSGCGNDELLLTDGPFAETEQIGGFVLINCADLDEAIEIAAKHPAAGYGTMEIRPVWNAAGGCVTFERSLPARVGSGRRHADPPDR